MSTPSVHSDHGGLNFKGSRIQGGWQVGSQTSVEKSYTQVEVGTVLCPLHPAHTE